MAKTTTHVPVGYGGGGTMTTATRGSNVDVSIVSSSDYSTNLGMKSDWTMYLERATSDGRWKVVGTRTGYVADGSPSHRTFTNVGPGRLKVHVVFGVQHVYSPSFVM